MKLNTNSENFAKELKEARIKAGLTQRALAEGVNISVVMVGRYEMGTAKPSDKTLFTIESFFSNLEIQNVPPATLRQLPDYSLDELLTEIKRRGFKVSLESLP